jgi:hypothetical protein
MVTVLDWPAAPASLVQVVIERIPPTHCSGDQVFVLSVIVFAVAAPTVPPSAAGALLSKDC